jgi:predicted RNA-binding protein YlqC (UPF0109 family)
VQLAQEDVRHVIGKNGMTISAIRSLLNTAAAKHGIKISLKVGSAARRRRGSRRYAE